MATYYISARINNEDVIFAMNATTDISNSSKGRLSEHKLENGNMAADNYRNMPEIISMSGVISDVFVGNIVSEAERKPTKDYIEGLKNLKNNKIPFTMHYSSDLTPQFPCFFKEFTIRQSTENGFGGVRPIGNHLNSYKVDMTVAVTRIGVAAVFTTGRASEFVDPTQEKATSSASTKAVDEGDSLITGGYLDLLRASTQIDEATTGAELPGG